MTPTVLAYASLAATIVGGVVQARAAQAQGKAAQAQADYQAAIDRNNAIRADFLAEDAIERGKESERKERLRGRLLLGQMRAVLAGSGQVVDEGSAGDLVIDQAATNELEALTVRSRAAREAQEFRIRGSQFKSQASLTELAGENARSRGSSEAIGTLIGTGGKVASKWFQFKRAGVPGF